MLEQRGEAWVNAATPEQVVAAQQGGELDAFLGRQVRVDPPAGGADLENWLTTATPEQIVIAQAAHKLDSLLGVVRNEFGNTADDLRGA